MFLRNPRPVLLFTFSMSFGVAACSSSSAEPAPAPTDTGSPDTATDSTVKDTSTGDVADTAAEAPVDSSKPDSAGGEVDDTGPAPDEGVVLFACGTETCSKKFQFCRQPTTSGGTATCILYPSTCGFPSCVCLTTNTTTCTSPSCKATPTPTCVEVDGAFTITCDKP
jgi:hypothetical protein